MFSKLSILSKFCKYSKLKQNEFRHLFINECRSIMPNRKIFTRNQQNVLLISQRLNTVTIKPNNNTCFKISSNMSSSNNEGNGKNTDITDKVKKLQISKKQLKRMPNVKGLKKSHVNCKRCKNNRNLDLNQEASVTPSTNLTAQKGNVDLKVQVSESINNQGILESQLPPKKVHVEFMESQNLKDFNLNKSPPLPITSNNAQQNVIHIKIDPMITVSGQTTPNVSSNELQKALIPLETNKLYLNTPNEEKNLTKRQETDLKKDKTQKSQSSIVIASNTSNSENALSSKFNNNLNEHQSTQMSFDMNKTKDTKTEKELKTDEFHERGNKNVEITKEVFENIAESSIKKDVNKESNSFTAVPSNNTPGVINSNSQTKLQMKSIKKPSKLKAELKEVQVLQSSIDMMDKSKVSNMQNKNKPKIQNKRTKVISETAGKNSKDPNAEENFTSNKFGTVSSVGHYENYSDKYTLPETLKDVESKSLPQKLKTTTSGTGILKTNKLTKFKGSNTGGSHGGNSSGGGKEQSETKARLNKFWRTLSITILPFILGLSIYATYNIGLEELFQRMHNAASNEKQLSWPTFYEKDTHSEELNMKEMEHPNDNE